MSYAIYRISAADPVHLGLEFAIPSTPYQNISDTRFFSFGKDPIAVQQDLFSFLAGIKRDLEERRVPDDLELMYVHETKPFPGMPYNPLAGAGVHDIQMEHLHQELVRGFDSIRLETVLIYGPDDEAVIDEAREIVRDREVTMALARVSNPHAVVMSLSRIITDIDRDSKRCVSFGAAAAHADYIEVLKASIESYQRLHGSLRFVTLATEQKES